MLDNTAMPIKDPVRRKQKQREYSKKYYENNKSKVIARVRANNAKNKRKWDKFKAGLSCVKCGFNHPAALDFHHTEPEKKTNSVHKLVRNKQFSAAYSEIQKCIVLCANCHRQHHYQPPLNPPEQSP